MWLLFDHGADMKRWLAASHSFDEDEKMASQRLVKNAPISDEKVVFGT